MRIEMPSGPWPRGNFNEYFRANFNGKISLDEMPAVRLLAPKPSIVRIPAAARALFHRIRGVEAEQRIVVAATTV